MFKTPYTVSLVYQILLSGKLRIPYAFHALNALWAPLSYSLRQECTILWRQIAVSTIFVF